MIDTTVSRRKGLGTAAAAGLAAAVGSLAAAQSAPAGR
ncbi:MAG: hypothetical protein JWR86_599 [Enterovirga sp.]|nr:hypothetical protein [Enterovirga sp.]